jgi:hypothetical protein
MKIKKASRLGGPLLVSLYLSTTNDLPISGTRKSRNHKSNQRLFAVSYLLNCLTKIHQDLNFPSTFVNNYNLSNKTGYF